MDKDLARLVRRRAHFAGEYCRLPERCLPGSFEIEHIVPRQHGGAATPANLAYSCLRCNRAKGPNITGIDRSKSRATITPLFHPRRNRWAAHFRWAAPLLVGRASIGRVTIQVLQINDPLRVELRAQLISGGEFPP